MILKKLKLKLSYSSVNILLYYKLLYYTLGDFEISQSPISIIYTSNCRYSQNENCTFWKQYILHKNLSKKLL